MNNIMALIKNQVTKFVSKKPLDVEYSVAYPQTDYMGSVYRIDEYTTLISKVAVELSAFRKEKHFDAIAFSGMSGAAVAFPVSAMTGIPLICVRKVQDNSHFRRYGDDSLNVNRRSEIRCEGHIGAPSYIILDDFSETGRTLDDIKNTIAEVSDAELRGIYLYKNYPTWNKKHRYAKLWINPEDD